MKYVYYVVSFEQTIQVTEDSWRVSLRTLIADENTTIRQIREWWANETNIRGTEYKMNDIKITDTDLLEHEDRG